MAGERTLKRLGEICEFRGGQGFPQKHQGAIVGEYPFIKVSDMELPGNRHRITRANHWIDEATRKELRAKPHPATSTVFAKIGMALTYNRRRLLSRPTILDNNMMAAVPIESEVEPLFLYYLLKATDFNEVVSGTALPFINGSDLAKMEVEVPPLADQKAIAAVLGALDDKIELNQRMNATLEMMARALFQSWFVDFNPVRAKLDGHPCAAIDPAILALFPDHIDHVSDMLLPKGWQRKAAYDCARFINGVAFRNVQFSTDGSGLPVVKIAELKDGISAQTKFTTDQLVPKYKIRDGEILFSWSGSPDTSIDTFVWAGGDGWLNQHIFKVEFHQPEEKLFVYYSLKHLKPTFIEIARDKQTTGLGHVTAQDMKRLHVAFPTKPILQAFQRTVQPIFERCFATLTESRTLATLRDTLLPKLLSGELSTTDLKN